MPQYGMLEPVKDGLRLHTSALIIMGLTDGFSPRKEAASVRRMLTLFQWQFDGMDSRNYASK